MVERGKEREGKKGIKKSKQFLRIVSFRIFSSFESKIRVVLRVFRILTSDRLFYTLSFPPCRRFINFFETA